MSYLLALAQLPQAQPGITIWQAIVLGLVEGITEYVPVSSTGHLILAGGVMDLHEPPARKAAVDAFVIVVQGGAILAVLLMYWRSVMRMFKGLAGNDRAGLGLLCNLAIAFLPAAVLGLLLDDWIEQALFHPGPVVLALLLGGVFMMLLDQWRNGRFGPARWHAGEHDVWTMTPRQAFIVGLMQCVALWPGTSRSMMTIAGGVVAGLKPRQAAEFSFLLGLPTLGAATLYRLTKNLAHARRTGEPNLFEALGVAPVVVGIIVAAVSAALAVRWLVGFLNRRGLTPFGWYRIGLCVILLIGSQSGWVRIGDSQRTVIRRQTTHVPHADVQRAVDGE